MTTASEFLEENLKPERIMAGVRGLVRQMPKFDIVILERARTDFASIDYASFDWSAQFKGLPDPRADDSDLDSDSEVTHKDQFCMQAKEWYKTFQRVLPAAEILFPFQRPTVGNDPKVWFESYKRRVMTEWRTMLKKELKGTELRLEPIGFTCADVKKAPHKPIAVTPASPVKPNPIPSSSSSKPKPNPIPAPKPNPVPAPKPTPPAPSNSVPDSTNVDPAPTPADAASKPAASETTVPATENPVPAGANDSAPVAPSTPNDPEPAKPAPASPVPKPTPTPTPSPSAAAASPSTLIRKNCALVRYQGSQFVNPAIVHREFLEEVQQLNAFAVQAQVRIFVNNAARRSGAKLRSAVVTPASRSNHHAGHAIDMNVIDSTGNLCTSKCLRPSALKNAHVSVRRFLTLVRESYMRWGGDFGKVDSVHIDNGLNVRNPVTYAAVRKETQDALASRCYL